MEKKVPKKVISLEIKKSINPPQKLKNSVGRIIQIYDLLKSGESLYAEDVCKKFYISARTFSRDIKVLKNICEEDIYFKRL